MSANTFPCSKRPVVLALSLAFVMPVAMAEEKTETTQSVVIKSRKADNSAELTRSAGKIDTPLQDTPFSVNRFDARQLQDLGARMTTDVSRFDASINDAYNAVGYAEQFSIRGFALDNNSSYRKDGFIIPADASIPLENKEAVEVLKGVAGFQSGMTTPGGYINYVVKRPLTSPLRTLNLELSERGTRYAAVDVSEQLAGTPVSIRLNAAAEQMRSVIRGANGNREFFSAAVDLKTGSNGLLRADIDYQHKSQLSAPGFQLWNGTDLPRGISADMMLNVQPWAKPVDTKSLNLGLQYQYSLNNDWQFRTGANLHRFQRDDYTAFPWGCTSGNLFPGYCANGDFDMYDYRSLNEAKYLVATDTGLQGKWNAAGMQHETALGFETSRRRDYAGDYVYDFAGVSNVFNPVAVPPSSKQPGPASLRRMDKETALYLQDIISLNTEWKLHLNTRRVQLDRVQFDNPGYNQQHWVSGAALVYKPVASLTTYLSQSQGLEYGGIAPVGTNNPNQMLNPVRSRQTEAGIKYSGDNQLQLSAAIFQITKPLELINAANYYVQTGEARHRGIELNAQGNLLKDLKVLASFTAIDTVQQDTGSAANDGKQVLNVPGRKASVTLDYSLPVAGLSVQGGWQYASEKAFSPDNRIMVPGYYVLNAGARYQTRISGVPTTFRAQIDNLTDRFYWRDVTQSLGGYLFPGAPRTVRLSAQLAF